MRAASETASSFSWDVAADYYLNLYQELHAITRSVSQRPQIEPLFYSTRGDYWGREIENHPPEPA